MEERNLYLSHSRYAYLLELQAKYSRIRPDGTVDDSRFAAEAISDFHLKPFTKYKIVIDD
jgi:hypothetical protein